MVRMDECVEAIYDKDTTTDKQKTMRMIRVLKGAVSVSKSKTGECIFRNNKIEARNLERTIKSFRRDSLYVKEKVDTHKRSVMTRWRRMLEKQTTVNSQSVYEEILDIKEPKQETNSCKDQTEDNDSVLKKFLDLRLQTTNTGINYAGFAKNFKRTETAEDKSSREGAQKNDENADEVYVTERKEIRSRYSKNAFGGVSTPKSADEHKVHGSVLCTSKPVRLPSVRNTASRGRRNSLPVSKEATEKSSDNNMVMFDRDLTDWADWRLKDQDWILEYIRRQRTRHEDLLIRNALNSIENDMSGPNMIRRQQVLVRLRNETTENTMKTTTYKIPRATSGPLKRIEVSSSSEKFSDSGSVKSSATFPRTRKRQRKVNNSWLARKAKVGTSADSGAKSSAAKFGDTRKIGADDMEPSKQTTSKVGIRNVQKQRRSSLRTVPGCLSVIPEIQIISPTNFT